MATADKLTSNHPHQSTSLPVTVVGSAPDWDALDLLPTPYVVLNDDLIISHLNKAAQRLLNIDYYHAVGRQWSELFALDDHRGRRVLLAEVIRQAHPATEAQQWWYLCREGAESLPVQLAFNVLQSSGATGASGVGMALHEVSGLHRIIQRLQHQSSHDELTGLVNRREFEARLERAVHGAQAQGHTHAVLFMDLDRFKTVNDRFGHSAGDHILSEVASRFRRMLRERDTLSRIGGDEFALLLEHCSTQDAVATARLLQVALHNPPLQWQQQSPQVAVSIGVSSIERGDAAAKSAMVAADLACYAAKQAAEDVIVVVPPGAASDPALRSRWQYHTL